MKALLMFDKTRWGAAAGPVASRALRTAAIYVSLVVWHFLFFHQLVLVASLYAIVTLAPACTHVLAFLAVGYLYFYFDRSELSGKRRWEWFLTSWITDALTDYFPMRLVRTQELPPGQYIFGIHPHGVMPWSAFPIGKTSLWPKLFPGIRVQVLTASCLFAMPITRELVLWAGGIDASRPTAERALESKFSLAVIPGGLLEILESRPHATEQVLVLERRKGFIELALKYGVPLVPVYAFGVTELYDQADVARSWRKWMIHRIRFAPTIAWGTSWSRLLPSQRPVHVVVGQPVVPVDGPTPEPSKEAIDALHSRYKQALRDLFEQHKQAYGYAGASLVIT